MGLEEADLSEGKVSCSICLEDVTDVGDRAWAKLQCSHQFHLDCIGSAFNVKGVMQCPNCRKIEKGQWLYADGHRPYPEINIDDLVNDDEVYELSYSEASLWCPYGGFTQLAATFDDDFPATGYHDIVGQHAVFSEHGTVSSATHICPYVAYVQPIHPSTSSNTSANVPEGPSGYNNQWNSQSATSEVPNSYGFPAMDFHYQTHADHPSAMPRRPARTNADMSRVSYVHHPFVVGQSSSTRAPSSNSSYMTHPGSAARAQERSQAFQAYFQQPTNSAAAMRTPLPTGPHRSNGQVQISQYGTSSDQTRGWSSSYNVSASSVSTEHSIWERDPNRPFHQSGGGSFRYRNGSDRTQSQSQYWL